MAKGYVVNRLIESKWSLYWFSYLVFGLFHTLIVCLVTGSAVLRAKHSSEPFGQIVSRFFVFLSLPYFIQEFLRRVYARQPYCFSAFHHNGFARVIFVLFAHGLSVDGIWNWTTIKTNHIIIPTLILGYWAMSFYLRSWKNFSFFTMFIYSVIFGDFFRFMIFMFIPILSYAAAIMVVVPRLVVEFKDYPISIVSVMKLFLEPGDISTHVENESEPVVMGVLLALYLCLTFLILLSSLIGMISNTCSNFMQDLEGQVQLQRLSISIFMEGMLPSIWKTKLKTKIKRKRYCFLKDTVKEVTETRFYKKIYSVTKNQLKDTSYTRIFPS